MLLKFCLILAYPAIAQTLPQELKDPAAAEVAEYLDQSIRHANSRTVKFSRFDDTGCAAADLLQRNAGNTAWNCAAPGASTVGNFSIDSDKIATKAVKTEKIEDSAVETVKIAADAVTTAKILNQNVTSAKLTPAITLSTLTVTNLNGTFYPHLYATSGAGTSASHWVGWEAGLNAQPSSSSVHFVAGFYDVSTPVVVGTAWKIRGDGVENTRLYYTGLSGNVTDQAIIQTSTNPWTSSYAYQVTIEDMYFEGTGKTYEHGIFGTFWLAHINRIKVKDFEMDGIQVNLAAAAEAYENYYTDIVAQSNGRDGLRLVNIGDSEILRLISRDNGAVGLNVIDAGAVKINESHFYKNQYGIRFKDSSRGFLNQSDVESNYKSGVHINGSGGNTIYGNNFWQNSFTVPDTTSTIIMEFTSQNSIVANNFYEYGTSTNAARYHIEEGRDCHSNSIFANAFKGWVRAPVFAKDGVDGPRTIVSGNYESYSAVSSFTATNFTVSEGGTDLMAVDFGYGVTITTRTKLSSGTFTVDGTGGDVSFPAGSIGESELASASVSTTKIATDAVDSIKLMDGSVNTGKLTTDAVTSVKVLDAAISTAKLATDSVIAAKILWGAVSTTKLAADAVVAAAILNGSVETAKIAAGAVSTAKLIGGGGLIFPNRAVCLKTDGTFGTCSTADASACGCQ